MREAWALESRKAAPTEGPAAAMAAEAIETEGERLVNDWTVECKKELEGRRVDPKEMDCLAAAKTLEQINTCAEL